MRIRLRLYRFSKFSRLRLSSQLGILGSGLGAPVDFRNPRIHFAGAQGWAFGLGGWGREVYGCGTFGSPLGVLEVLWVPVFVLFKLPGLLGVCLFFS